MPMSESLPGRCVKLNRRACIVIHVTSHAPGLKNHLGGVAVSIHFNRAGIGIALMALLLACCSDTAFATSRARVVRQGPDEQVTLTVTSGCGSASVKVKKHFVLTTPFSVNFPRG